MHFCNFSDLHKVLLTAMDPSVKTTIEQRLVETGEKERLKEHLRLIIFSSSSWWTVPFL